MTTSGAAPVRGQSPSYVLAQAATFDSLACASLAAWQSQWSHYYRFGNLENCSENLNNIYICLRAKAQRDENKARVRRMFARPHRRASDIL